MAMQYPKLCPLCGDQIEAAFDEDYHGQGVCVESIDDYDYEDEEEDYGAPN